MTLSTELALIYFLHHHSEASIDECESGYYWQKADKATMMYGNDKKPLRVHASRTRPSIPYRLLLFRHKFMYMYVVASLSFAN